MNKTYETGIRHEGEPYQARVYEDPTGEKSPIFVVERGDGKPMTNEQARGVFDQLVNRSDFDASQARLWEQSPDGKLTEHTISTFTYDSNPMQHDMGGDAYAAAVKAGMQEPQISTGYNHKRTEVSTGEAWQEVGLVVQSHEQSMAQEWNSMSGPKA